MISAFFYLAAIVALFAAAFLLWAWAAMVRMPGRSFAGAPPPLSEEERKAADRLERDVRVLALDIGERNVQRKYLQLAEAAGFIENSLEEEGYEVFRQAFDGGGKEVWNLWAEKRGNSRADEVIVVGSHYDTVPGSPGANDNASAVAANLELSRMLREAELERTVRFVFLANEEEPYFMTNAWGGLQYANACRAENRRILGMICLETMGCYSEQRGSQKYPPPLGLIYPTKGNFVSFVGNLKSKAWVRAVVESFRRNAAFPSEGIAATELIRDIRRSDHYAFWIKGYPALMVTDTADFRYAHYHQPTDTPDKLNYEALSRVVCGLKRVLEELCGS